MTRLPSDLVVGIAGTRNSGKDTLFSHLKSIDPRFQHFAFANALKSDLRPLLTEQFGIDPLTAIGADKELIRPVLIAFGCAWRERDVDHWAKVVAGQIRDNHQNNPQPLIACVCDFRFASEVELFRAQFGPVFRLVNLARTDAPEPTDEEKKHFRKVAAMADHSILWGNDTEAQRLEVARGLVSWLESSLSVIPPSTPAP